MPYPSSQMESTTGACSTPMAFTASQNMPSAQVALPTVPNATSSPLRENCVNCLSSSTSRYSLEACPSPTSLGICDPVGERSAEELYMAVRSFQEPSSFKL